MLTEEQKQQIERNRQAALKLREQKAKERAAAAARENGTLKELTEQGGFCSGSGAAATDNEGVASSVSASSTAASSSSSGVPSSAAHKGCCEACGQQGMIDETFVKTFEVRVCLHCKVSVRSRGNHRDVHANWAEACSNG